MRESWRLERSAEERDDGVAVTPRVAVARQLLVAPMLDAEHRREGSGQPAFGKTRREREAVWRIGEGDVEGMRRERLDETKRVRSVHHDVVAGAERFDV